MKPKTLIRASVGYAGNKLMITESTLNVFSDASKILTTDKSVISSTIIHIDKSGMHTHDLNMKFIENDDISYLESLAILDAMYFISDMDKNTLSRINRINLFCDNLSVVEKLSRLINKYRQRIYEEKVLYHRDIEIIKPYDLVINEILKIVCQIYKLIFVFHTKSHLYDKDNKEDSIRKFKFQFEKYNHGIVLNDQDAKKIMYYNDYVDNRVRFFCKNYVIS